MLSPIPRFSAGFFCLLFLCNSFLFFPNLSTSPFSSRSFLPLQDFPSLHFPVPNSSKTSPHGFPKLLFIPCSLLTLLFFSFFLFFFFFFHHFIIIIIIIIFYVAAPTPRPFHLLIIIIIIIISFFSFLVNKIRK